MHGIDLTVSRYPDFFRNLEALAKARKDGKLSHRNRHINMTLVADYVKEIAERYQSIMFNSKNANLSHYELKELRKRLKEIARVRAKEEEARRRRSEEQERIRQKTAAEWQEFNARKKGKGVGPKSSDEGNSPR